MSQNQTVCENSVSSRCSRWLPGRGIAEAQSQYLLALNTPNLQHLKQSVKGYDTENLSEDIWPFSLLTFAN